MERGSIEIELKSIFCGSKTAWKKILKPTLNATVPKIGVALGPETKNPAVAKATRNILESTSGAKLLSLTDIYGNGLRLKVI